MSEIVARMERLRNDADVALSEGDYDTARTNYTRLLALIESGAVENEKDGHRFRMGDIEKALKAIDRLESSTSTTNTTYRRIDINYKRPTLDC